MKGTYNYESIKPLMTYFKQFGTIADIKQNQIYMQDGEIVKIGLLVSNLRQDKKRGILNSEVVEMLDYMGMVWDKHQTFKEDKELLKEWYMRNGTLKNLNQYSKIEINGEVVEIGEALSRLRLAKKEGTLTKSQIKFCDMLEIVWAPHDTEVAYAPLLMYYEKNGTLADVKTTDVFDDGENTYNIGKQLNHLRTRYNKGLLSPEEIEFFENRGIVWSKKKHSQEVEEM